MESKQQKQESSSSLADSSAVHSTDTISTATPEQSYSSDPFASNYRIICPEEERDWSLLPTNYVELVESAEYAEFGRPGAQLFALLRQRGLEEKFHRIMDGEGLRS